MSAEQQPSPRLQLLGGAQQARILEQARQVLEELGVRVEWPEAVELLCRAGARIGPRGRVHIGATLVESALETLPDQVLLYDRDGEGPLRLGAGPPRFAPGSAAITVLDPADGARRPSTRADSEHFARLTEKLPGLALQSTCVVPSDVPLELADRERLRAALVGCRKPIVTGTFARGSFEPMRSMLARVRGGDAALRERPLAIFDCCPTPPLSWSELTVADLIACARSGVPAELITMPMTGATAPVTLHAAAVQLAAENLSGVVIHQLAGPGSPLIWGVCASVFDMRHGTTALGAVEATMLNLTSAQLGRALGLPTHAYLALSDSKLVDYQAGFESGCGALLAVLGELDVVSGAGMLEFAKCQSLEKLLLDHEVIRTAQRLAGGLREHTDVGSLEVIRQGLEGQQFLNLDHTRRWFREELCLPGVASDRQVAESWSAEGGRGAAARSRLELEGLLEGDGGAALDGQLARELRELAEGL